MIGLTYSLRLGIPNWFIGILKMRYDIPKATMLPATVLHWIPFDTTHLPEQTYELIKYQERFAIENPWQKL